MKTFLNVTAAGGALLLSGCTTPETASRAATQTAAPPKTDVRTSAQQNSKLTPQSAANTVLDRYIARDENAFDWKETARKGQNIELQVTSQRWQNITWKHRVEIVRPARNEFPDRALLVIGFGNGSERETFFSQIVANALGATVVNAWNVPNQPLFDMREDDLIAHTFSKYLESGDTTWPLLLPMTKSATQIMRAVAQWSRGEAAKSTDKTNKPLTNWVVSGASKRGWTTWLSAAAVNSSSFQNAFKSDALSVNGIIPMVYDNLNLPLQMPHQKASWGAYSGQIADYARRGLPDLANTEKGRELVQIVDPFSYRARLDLPKLIINGSNDPYWPLDSFNLYASELPGKNDVFYAPNSGHGLNGNEAKVAGISVAWFRALAKNQTMPYVMATLGQKVSAGKLPQARGEWKLEILSNGQTPNLKAARVWFASSATRDFRQAKWQSLPLENPVSPAPRSNASSSKIFRMNVNLLQTKLGDNRGEYLAAFGEIELESDLAAQSSGLNLNLPFLLSSPVTIWKN